MLASLVLKSLRNLLLHFLHFYNIRFPCSSAKLAGLNPDLKCSPSVFCDTKNFKIFNFSRVTRDMWVNEGSADLLSTTFLLVPVIPWALFSQTPAPVFKTVFTPDRKSGIPQEVDIPAPVKAMKCLLFKIRLATSFTFSYRTSFGSKCSFFSSSVLRIVSAIRIYADYVNFVS